MKRTPNGTTDQIREILRDAGGPLTLAQVIEALPQTAERANVWKLMHRLKERGEVATLIEDGKAQYALIPGIAPPRVGRKPKAPSSSPPEARRSCAPTTGPAAVASPEPAPVPARDELFASTEVAAQALELLCADELASLTVEVGAAAREVELALRLAASEGQRSGDVSTALALVGPLTRLHRMIGRLEQVP